MVAMERTNPTAILAPDREPTGAPDSPLGASVWATQQWATVRVGDRRLVRRIVAIGAAMAQRPDASLPEQMEGWSALKAAYRVLENPVVTLEALLLPHCQATLAAARLPALVLWCEDTTELDFTAHRQMSGLGPIGNSWGRGLLLHSTLGVEPMHRQVLGVAHAQVVLRQPSPSRHAHWTNSPESQVWEVSARAIGPPPAGSVWIHVSDCGSDIFGYLAACIDLHKDFLVRAYHNRVLGWEAGTPEADDETAHFLLDYARSLPPAPASATVVHVPAHPKHPARDATVVLQWARVTLPAPRRAPHLLRAHAPLDVGLVRVWEPEPPAGVEPLEWVLLRTQPVQTVADAQRSVAWYTCRWLCEDYHQCLKTGCRIERSQLDDGADIRRLLGFAIPIAVRLLQLRQGARDAPEQLATATVDPLLVTVLSRHLHLDAAALTLAAFWRAVAQLGGYLGRRGDGPPGWRTLWRGWQKLTDWTRGAHLMAREPIDGHGPHAFTHHSI